MRAPSGMLVRESEGALGPAGAVPVGRMANRLALEDRAIHDWYRFVLAFPPHLVRAYLDEFGAGPGRTLLDPFCGTGTTLVEGKKLGCGVLGFEANPMAHLAASVKTRWDVEGKALLDAADACARRASQAIAAERELRALPAETETLLLKNSICPRPLHKALILVDAIDGGMEGAMRQAAQVALASTLVQSASNLHFGPEVGVRGRKQDADVVGAWLDRIRAMAADLAAIGNEESHGTATIFRHDARQVPPEVTPRSVDAVFTSPPYPNEKDYTRTTRLESVVLGLFATRRSCKPSRSNSCGRTPEASIGGTPTSNGWQATSESRRFARRSKPGG